MFQCDDLSPTFFCVPDITGFTRLIATADIEFSKEIIPGLLRRLIDTNMLGMSVGEIEGDAIFFYKMGRLPAANRVKEQCRRFYQRFNSYISQFEKSHPEYYKKHLSKGQVGLKIIVHYGCACTANIKGRIKLIGQDVIITHRLLKNGIPENDYVLLTHDYIRRTEFSSAGEFFDSDANGQGTGSERYEFLGEIKYSYLSARGLNEAVTDDHDKKKA